MKQKKSHLSLAKNYWKELLNPDDFVIDATCGNGHDTAFLSTLLPNGGIYSFDIQEEALEKAKLLLGPASTRVSFFLLSHAEWEKLTFPKAPRLIVYNLGYLPGGNKELTTRTQTTLKSLYDALFLLSEDGALSIMCYPGHEEGRIEEEAIRKWAEKLPSHKWLSCHHQFVNRLRSPSLFWIESIR